MELASTLIKQAERRFVPQNYTFNKWDDYEPFFNELNEMSINNQEEFINWYAKWDEFRAIAGEDMRWRYIKTSIDTTNQKAQEALQQFYTDINPKINVWENKLQLKFNESPYKNSLPDSFKNIKRGIETDLKLFNQDNIELIKEASLLQNEYSQISGAWQINYNGKDLTLPQANKLLKDNDENLRKEIYCLVNERQQQDVQKLDDLFDKLIKLRHQMALNSGYANYRDYMFDEKHRFDYSVEDCKEFHQSIANVIMPIITKLDEAKCQDFGKDKMKPWDTQVDPLNKPPLTPFNGTEEFVQKTIDCFEKLDPYFAECIKEMNEAGRLDLESRKGKSQGGYMMGMPETGIPFIFMNHANSEGDVRVMVHEGGHAVHSFLAFEIPFCTQRDTPSEVAELASMSMELFTLENWEGFYPNTEDLKRAKKDHMTGLLRTLAGVARGDEFQHWIYENPSHTASERQEKWMELSKKYGTGKVDYTGYENYVKSSFQAILHFYEVPFYYIEYGFAQLGAIALWKNYKEKGQQAINEYKDALALGYTKSIPEIFATAGISFDFSETNIAKLGAFVQNQMNILK